MSDRIRFGTWNLNWMSRSEESQSAKIAYLRDAPWELMALQEVTSGMAVAIREAGLGDEFLFPAGIGERGFGSALLARGGVRVRRPSLLADLPKPRLGIWAEAGVGRSEFDVVSWHAPNAAKSENRFVKRDAYIALNAWACARTRPALIGADANHGSLFTRETDFPDSSFKPYPDDDWAFENRFWTNPEHDLRDAWIAFLAEHPDVLAEVRSRWEAGPSAVSYTRGSTKHPVPDRFDYVLLSPEFTIRRVEHDYEGGLAATSDHGPVFAELELG